MPQRDGGRPLAEWYAETAERLVETLTRVDADAPAWTFASDDRSVAFWCRRQLHETLVHTADIQLAGRAVGDLSAGQLYADVDAEVAADGIAEILTVFLPRMARAAKGGAVEVIPAPAPIVLAATDCDRSWSLHVSNDAPRTNAGADPDAVATLAGPSASLNLAIWRRTTWDGIERRGDQAAALRFIEGLRLP